MKISTKGRYALRIMLELALAKDEGFISIKEIAGKQDISEKYAEQIVNQLNKAGMVKSSRGAKGGYLLNRSASEYSVGEILRLMEGTLAPVSCLDSGVNGCQRRESCVTVEIWEKIFNVVNQVVDGITLEDLRSRQMELLGECERHVQHA